MPEEIDNFIDALNYYDAESAITDDPKVHGFIDNAQRLGLDILESLQNLFKPQKTKNPEIFDDSTLHLPPPPPPGLVRTISETAFLEPKNITPLDEVTKPELKEYISFSKIFKDTSFGVRDLTVSATYNDRNHNNSYTVRAGDKVGFKYSKKQSSTTYSVDLEHNLFSGRTRASYTAESPISSYDISVYHKHGDIGATGCYSHNSGLVTSLSADKDGMALSAGYRHDYKDCKLTVKGFISTQKRKLDTYETKNYSALIGVCGTITLH